MSNSNKVNLERAKAIRARQEKETFEFKRSKHHVEMLHPCPSNLLDILGFIALIITSYFLFLNLDKLAYETNYKTVISITVIPILALLFLSFIRGHTENTKLTSTGSQLYWGKTHFDPKGKQVKVTHTLHELKTRNGTLLIAHLSLSAPVNGKQEVLFSKATSIGRVRVFAETLCKMGGYSLVWMNAAGTEVRQPNELDLPLWVRTLESPPEPELRSQLSFTEEHFKTKSIFKPQLKVNKGYGPLNNLTRITSIQADTDGLTINSSTLGYKTKKHFKNDEIESIYFESHDRNHLLVIVETNWDERTHFNVLPDDIRYLRYKITLALAGIHKEDTEIKPLHTAYINNENFSSLKCPRCTTTLMSEEGQLGEQNCVQCKGSLLSPAGAELLLRQELAIRRNTLLEILDFFPQKSISCPSCHTFMNKAQIVGSEIDFCKGCGSLWLDENELSAMTHGRRGVH